MEHDQNSGVVAQSITRVILYVCMTFVACFWFSSCQLTDDLIKNCRDSCNKGFGNYMESVTPRECVCGAAPTIEPIKKKDIWVLP